MTQPNEEPGQPMRATGSLPPISRRALAIGLVLLVVALGVLWWYSTRTNDDRFSPTTDCGQLYAKDAAAVRAGRDVDPADDERRLDCRG
jgi:hypothetical protein